MSLTAQENYFLNTLHAMHLPLSYPLHIIHSIRHLAADRSQQLNQLQKYLFSDEVEAERAGEGFGGRVRRMERQRQTVIKAFRQQTGINTPANKVNLSYMAENIESIRHFNLCILQLLNAFNTKYRLPLPSPYILSVIDTAEESIKFLPRSILSHIIPFRQGDPLFLHPLSKFQKKKASIDNANVNQSNEVKAIERLWNISDQLRDRLKAMEDWRKTLTGEASKQVKLSPEDQDQYDQQMGIEQLMRTKGQSKSNTRKLRFDPKRNNRYHSHEKNHLFSPLQNNSISYDPPQTIQMNTMEYTEDLPLPKLNKRHIMSPNSKSKSKKRKAVSNLIKQVISEYHSKEKGIAKIKFSTNKKSIQVEKDKVKQIQRENKKVLPIYAGLLTQQQMLPAVPQKSHQINSQININAININTVQTQENKPKTQRQEEKLKPYERLIKEKQHELIQLKKQAEQFKGKRMTLIGKKAIIRKQQLQHLDHQPIVEQFSLRQDTSHRKLQSDPAANNEQEISNKQQSSRKQINQKQDLSPNANDNASKQPYQQVIFVGERRNKLSINPNSPTHNQKTNQDQKSLKSSLNIKLSRLSQKSQRYHTESEKQEILSLNKYKESSKNLSASNQSKVQKIQAEVPQIKIPNLSNKEASLTHKEASLTHKQVSIAHKQVSIAHKQASNRSSIHQLTKNIHTSSKDKYTLQQSPSANQHKLIPVNPIMKDNEAESHKIISNKDKIRTEPQEIHQNQPKQDHSLSNIIQPSLIKLPIHNKQTNCDGFADNQSFPVNSSRNSLGAQQHQMNSQYHINSGFYSGKDAERASKMYRRLSEKDYHPQMQYPSSPSSFYLQPPPNEANSLKIQQNKAESIRNHPINEFPHQIVEHQKEKSIKIEQKSLKIEEKSLKIEERSIKIEERSIKIEEKPVLTQQNADRKQQNVNKSLQPVNKYQQNEMPSPKTHDNVIPPPVIQTQNTQKPENKQLPNFNQLINAIINLNSMKPPATQINEKQPQQNPPVTQIKEEKAQKNPVTQTKEEKPKQSLNPNIVTLQNTQELQQNPALTQPTPPPPKCVFLSKNISTQDLHKIFKIYFNGVYSHMVDLVDKGYFRGRHLVCTMVMVGQEKVALAIYHVKMGLQARSVWLLHCGIFNQKYKDVEASILSTLIKYIFMNDPCQSLLFLSYHRISTYTDKAMESLKKMKCFSQTTFCPSALHQTKIACIEGEADQQNNASSLEDWDHRALLFSRKDINCTKQQEYTSVMDAGLVIVVGQAGRRQWRQSDLKGNQSIMHSKKWLQVVQEKIINLSNGHPISDTKIFPTGGHLLSYLNTTQLPTLPTSSLPATPLSLTYDIMQSCLDGVRFSAYAGYFYVSVEMPYCGYWEGKDVWFIAIKAAQNKYFLLGDKMYEDVGEIDFPKMINQYIDGKPFLQTFSNKPGSQYITIPQFQSKRTQVCPYNNTDSIAYSNSTPAYSLSGTFSLNWQDYIKGTRFMPEQTIFSELICPFFCGVFELQPQGTIKWMYGILVEEDDLIAAT